jgi:hypothetical protein
MIDVAVRVAQSPSRWIFRESPTHILMKIFLQVDPHGAKGTYENIRTNARLLRHVTAGIIKSDV